MVKIDLRALSAPFDEMRPEIQAAYEKLDKQWDAIIKQLKKLPIPCKVSCSFNTYPWGMDDRDCLEFGKRDGSKRLWIASYRTIDTPEGPDESCDKTFYEEWSAEQRLHLLDYVPLLFEAAAKQTKEFVNKINEHGGER